MEANCKLYEQYIKILKEELIPAMGCTEPIAIAYCASLVKAELKQIPTSTEIYVSGNILKNVKSVTVPNTNGMHGIETAVAIGYIAGKPEKKLEVISEVSPNQIKLLHEYLSNNKIIIKNSNNDSVLYIEIIGKYLEDVVKVVIKDGHINVTLIEKNNNIIYKKNDIKKIANKIDYSVLSIKNIYEFAEKVNLDEVKDILQRQIDYNMAIAFEGLNNNYGANIGKTILKYGNNDIVQYAKALAAAASDARMNGCDLPVVINSGSGNQGITASVPVIAFARKNNLSIDKLYRALLISNLCTIHIKNNIGKLSAFCGVVIAGAGSGAGIAYLDNGKENEINHTIVNTLAIVSGMVCDGAKSSCAAKICSAVEAGFLGYFMYKEGNQFLGGDGIIKKGVENTIKAIGDLAHIGMCETDKEIISLMLEDKKY